MKLDLTTLAAGGALVAMLGLGACANDAQIASSNLSQMADSFQINRRIVFVNGFTDTYLLVIEGLCSQDQTEHKLTVTCKTGPNAYKKHFLVLSNNVTAVSEQLDAVETGVYHYKVTFKPSSLIPSIDVR